MTIDIARQHRIIAKASANGWATFRSTLIEEANNDLVSANWDVTYSAVTKDISIEAKVSVVYPNDRLLQIWLKDEHPGIWIPEYRPWLGSVVEFSAAQNIKKAKVGLFDSKWREEDMGETYHALFWGYLSHDDNTESFAFQREFEYPN